MRLHTARLLTNVGADELAAVALARAVKYDLGEFDDITAYATSLLSRLVEIKQLHDSTRSDPDGYGAGVFWSIFRELTEYLASIRVKPNINPFDDKTSR